jgi:hypothetical protein
MTTRLQQSDASAAAAAAAVGTAQTRRFDFVDFRNEYKMAQTILHTSSSMINTGN